MRVSGLLVLLTLLVHPAFGAGHDWMTSLPDDRSLSELLIPGTHDSGALHEPLRGTSQCQSLTIAEQLAAGVRFLDVRCRHVKNGFLIHHGMIYQHANFDDVLAAVTDFLEKNPGEVVVMSVMETFRPEENTRTFVETLRDYISRGPERWRLENSIPRLGEARGRIVLFRRFGMEGAFGIDGSAWPGNRRFSGEHLEVQDNFVVPDAGAKWAAVEKMFAESKEADSSALWLNFTSGYVRTALGLPNILGVSEPVNRRLDEWSPAGERGIVVMDFATPELCRKIFEANQPSGLE